MNKSSSSSVVI